VQGHGLGGRGAEAAEHEVERPAAVRALARVVDDVRAGNAEVVVGPGQREVRGVAGRGRLGRDDHGQQADERELGRDAGVRNRGLLEVLGSALAREKSGEGLLLVGHDDRAVLDARGEAVAEGHVVLEVGLRARGRGGRDEEASPEGQVREGIAVRHRHLLAPRSGSRTRRRR
jgi:hypothetical protein